MKKPDSTPIYKLISTTKLFDPKSQTKLYVEHEWKTIILVMDWNFNNKNIPWKTNKFIK